MSKSKPTYALRCSANELNLRFYERYDHYFLYNKARSLMYIITEKGLFQEQIEKSNEFGLNINEEFFASLRAEIYFTALHQFEGFFALLKAMFQPLPHWIYLTEYQTREIKVAIEQFLNKDINSLTCGEYKTQRDFIQYCLYGPFMSNEETHVGKWDDNLDNIIWLIERMGQHYLEANEYNAYKHGMRIMVAPSYVKIGLNNPDGSPTGVMHTLSASEDAFSYLELKDIGEGGKTVYETNKHFSPKESFFYIEQIYLMLETIKNTRLAHLREDTSVTIQVFLDLDKDKVYRESKKFKWTLTI